MRKELEDYIIRGGEYGAERLYILSEALMPYTMQIIEKAGVSKGDTVLDVGCGAGAVTVEIAKKAGSGCVAGVDFDEKVIAEARKTAKYENIDVDFIVGDVADYLLFADRFDFVYARFILTHLKDPAKLIRQMRAYLKKGGSIILEDIDFSGHFCYPESAAYDKYVQWYERTARYKGLDPHIGKKLFGCVKNSGFRDIEVDVVNPAHQSGVGKMIASLTLYNIAHTVVSAGLCSAAEMRDAIAELEEFTFREDSILGMPRIFRIVAKM